MFHSARFSVLILSGVLLYARRMAKPSMRTLAVGVLGAIGVLVAMAVVAFAVGGTDFFLYKVFAPRQEAVRREVFEQSKAYNEGMQQELQSMAFQYEQTDASHRAALASLILHRVADYDIGKLNPNMRRFIESLRAERMGGVR